LNERDDSQFWRDLRSMNIPESLSHKINLFRESGKICREQDDLFIESSWLQVMMGQGIQPRDYHPLANQLSDSDLAALLSNMKAIKCSPLDRLPIHDDFLHQVCAR